jgi:hypothetical protein
MGKRMAIFLVLLSTVPMVWAQTAASPEPKGTVNFASLLGEMISRDVMARLPGPGYRCLQASSFDRKTLAPDQPGWFANDDWSWYVRKEQRDGRTEWVMMDAEGPGCVVRIWCTGPAITGTLRFYIDGADKPVIEGKAVEIVGGKALTGEPLSALRARGFNLYLPIPYAKQCKITYDGPNFWETKNNQDPFYYQVNYRTYSKGTVVESFGPATLKANADLLGQTQSLLLSPGKALDPTVTATSTVQVSGTAASGTANLSGPSAIRRLVLKVKAANLEQALRSLVLRMEFDGEAAVWCPAGDFFGSGVGLNPYQCWWQAVEKGGTLVSYWPMPFEKTAVVMMENLGAEPVDAMLTVEQRSWKWDERSMHFHANWQYRYPFDSQPAFDWNYLTAQGQGVLAGDVLTVLNTSADWWGEGDEKIFVDGEAFPSHLGTGTEDYYGYAYCTPEFFEDPFHAQPRADGPRNFGRVTNLRCRSLDAIPFDKSIRFDIEVWHWTKATMEYATTVYWYARPGAEGNVAPLPKAAAAAVAPVPSPYRKVAGAIEGETLTIRAKTSGETEVQALPEHNWSWGKQLWWRDGKVGDTLSLEFAVEEKGRYAVKANLTLAGDYGQVQMAIDGQKLGGPLDLYNDGVTTAETTLGTAALDKGTHVLTVEIVGANEKAQKRYMFGLDYIKLDKTE